MAENEIAEIQQRVNAALIAAIQAAGQLAQVAIDVRVAQLQRAARASEERARQLRAQTRAAHQADAVVWRAASRPAWWRRASAEDIAQVWRSASAWAQVDPRAEAVRRLVAERLADRGVHINLTEGDRPENAAWLSDALDRAAALDTTVDGTRADGPAAASPRSPTTNTKAPGAVPGSGSAKATPDPGGTPPSAGRPDPEELRAATARRREQMADHVRAAWPAERAERVLKSQAWPVLAYKLDQLKQQGHDVEDLLRRVPGFVDRAHTPAAYAFRVVDDAAQDLVEDQRASAAARRADERDERTIEGQWQEAGTEPATVAETRAGDAQVDANDQATQADSHDARAAQLAAQGYPTSTKTAVAGVTDKSARANPDRSMAERRLARTAPTDQPRNR